MNRALLLAFVALAIAAGFSIAQPTQDTQDTINQPQMMVNLEAPAERAPGTCKYCGKQPDINACARCCSSYGFAVLIDNYCYCMH